MPEMSYTKLERLLGPHRFGHYIAPAFRVHTYSERELPDSRPIIGIYGSALDNHAQQVDPAAVETAKGLAEKLGQELARYDVIIKQGACPKNGFPTIAAEAAKQANPEIFSFGIAPYPDEKSFLDHGGYVGSQDLIIYVGHPKLPPVEPDGSINKLNVMARSVLNPLLCDGAVFIGGASGTLSEIASAYEAGRVLCLIEHDFGISPVIKVGLDRIYASKDPGTVFFTDDSPADAVLRLLSEIRAKDLKCKGTPVTQVAVYHKRTDLGERVFVNIREAGRPATEGRAHMEPLEISLYSGIDSDALASDLVGRFEPLRHANPRPDRREKGRWFNTEYDNLGGVLIASQQIRSTYKPFYFMPF
ncbi:MAG: hypothetical protein ABH879_08510 [archaeon]